MPPLSADIVQMIIKESGNGEPWDQDHPYFEEITHLTKTDTPKEVHRALFIDSDVGEALSPRLLQKIYNAITPPPKKVQLQYWKPLAPFCHGTSSYSADQIQKDGLKPRLLTKVSQWEESGLASMPDRSYIGTAEGITKCFSGMLNANYDIPDGSIFFFDTRLLHYQPVFDEDCMNVFDPSEYIDPVLSAEACHSFGVRKRVPPQVILKRFDFSADLKKTRQTLRKMCTYIAKNSSYPKDKCITYLEMELKDRDLQ